jgi:hypothetical protein
MEDSQRDPVIDDWLRRSGFGEQGPQMTTDQLTGLLVVAKSNESPTCPDGVLTAWYQAIARHRRVVDQSEPAFIEQARRQGWTWQKIAEVLGLPSAEAAERRCDVLAAELVRTHPSQTPQPWLPWGDPRARIDR